MLENSSLIVSILCRFFVGGFYVSTDYRHYIDILKKGKRGVTSKGFSRAG